MASVVLVEEDSIPFAIRVAGAPESVADQVHLFEAEFQCNLYITYFRYIEILDSEKAEIFSLFNNKYSNQIVHHFKSTVCRRKASL